LKDLEGFELDQLDKWKSEMSEAEYSDEGLGLNMGGKMMNLDLASSTLTVNYSDRLVLLIREVRQLAEIGLKGKVPP
jgi:dynein heavy chain 2